MIIFWRLVLAHLLTDFTFQTNFIASWKRRNVWGCVAHSLVFLVCSWVLCWGYLTNVWVSLGHGVVIQGWVAIVILTVFHFLEDEWRVWTIQKLNSPDSFAFFLWDQFIHFILIFIVAPHNSSLYPEKWVLLLILFVLTTHFTTIFIYYAEKIIAKKVDIPADKKYISMIGRLLMSLALLLPGFWALSFILVGIFTELSLRIWQKSRFSLVNSVVGYFLAVVAGVVARIIYY